MEPDSPTATTTTDDATAAETTTTMEVWKICTRQEISGCEDHFLVEVAPAAKRVRASRTELERVAPDLVASFDANERDRRLRRRRDESVAAVGGGRGGSSSSRAAKTKTTTYAELEDDDDEEAAESEEDDDDDDSGEFGVESDDDDETNASRKRRGGQRTTTAAAAANKKKKRPQVKPRVQGTRVSSRSRGSKPVNYDLGEYADSDDDDEDEVMELGSENEASEDGEGEGEGEQGPSDDELTLIEREGSSAADKGKGREVLEVDGSDDAIIVEGEIGEGADGVGENGESLASVDEHRPQDLHFSLCANPKCGKRPASELLAAHEQKLRFRRKTGGRKKKRNEDEFDTDEEREMDEAKGAWVECETCVSAYHFGCLTATIQKNVKTRLDSEHSSRKRDKVELDVAKVLRVKKCTSCEKPSGATCFECERTGKRVTEFERAHSAQVLNQDEDVAMAGTEAVSQEIAPGLMFRCQTCRRCAHYGCLEPAQFQDADTTWQNHTLAYFKDGVCHECNRYDNLWQVELDVILGWKESDKAGTKPLKGEKVTDKKTGLEYVLPSPKDSLAPALYLVKWKGWSYRDLDWVQHSWLAARANLKLSNFLSKGSTVSFEPSKEDLGDDEELEPDAKEAAALLEKNKSRDQPVGPAPDPEIEKRIPEAWRTVDRVINVTYVSPTSGRVIAFKDFFKSRPLDDRESVKHVAKAYIKWCGLPYSQATEQDPPKEGEEGYEGYFKAYQAFIVASQREMRVPRLTPSEMAQLDAKRKGQSPIFTQQPDTIKNGQLMDFQIQGLSFLLNHWWVKTGCILADEMGLGKTCQLICFLSYLNLALKARPFLIIVPNSLVSNWLREFEKWAPELRTVAYNGDSESRRIVEQFEMFADNGDLKTHVVITTYEALKGHASVFARCTRWDCVVIDEGQALKSGEGNKLWAGIDKLRIGMKILLTGTPLNNNLRELYNLLNFLDPEKFADVDHLADPTREMTKERVDEIREDLRPYMLRRTKDQVLNLPPLGEFVVPVSLTLLQRQLYRGILEKNSAAILNIVNNAGKTKSKAKVTTTTNTLMTLRKIVCHPYLHVPELDPGDTVPASEAFRQLTDASAKLVLLERMLPKLREKGHKVLIFSQFKIVLNKLGPFLDGLGTKWLRLDGDTPQLERQRDVDRFNDPNSPYSVFILSTRAGGVGLTLTAADVVIIFDQDFNPFQDMQAIARAHRIGQKNPVRVFRLVVKGTCEEKILASGRKKQGLEHLIISKIDAKDDETEDVAGALQYGAQAILETDDAEAEKTAQRYTDAEIEQLLSKTAEPLSEAAKANAGAFATAQVWVSEKGGLGDVTEVGGEVEAEQDLQGFWDRIVAKEAEKEQQEKKEQDDDASWGRARRAKKAVNYIVPTAIVPMSDVEKAKRRRAAKQNSGRSDYVSSSDEFRFRSELDGSSSDEFTPGPDLDEEDRRISKGGRPPVTRRSSDHQLAAQSKPSQAQKAEDESDLRRLQRRKVDKRKQAIQPLIQAAIELDDVEVLATLKKAMNTEDAVEQKRLILEATRVLDERADPALHVPSTTPAAPAPAAEALDDDAASAAPLPPRAEPVPANGTKRRSESPAAGPSHKRQKPSPPAAAQPQSAPSSSSSKPTLNGGPAKGATSTTTTTTTTAATSMIRSDSKPSVPDAASSATATAKKAGGSFSQSKLSFAPKPPASSDGGAGKKSSPTNGAAPLLPGPPPLQNKPNLPVAGPHAASSSSSSSSAAATTTTSKAGKKGGGGGKREKKSDLIVISDSEED